MAWRLCETKKFFIGLPKAGRLLWGKKFNIKKRYLIIY